MMLPIRQGDTILVPTRAEDDDGTYGDGWLPLTPLHPQFEQWQAWLAKPLKESFQERLHPRDRAGRWMRRLGLKLYEVGGAVRDPLLGKEPRDIDYVAMASPEKIKEAVGAAGGRTQDLTVRDRLVGVRAHHPDLPSEGVEIAPPRVEISTGPGRHDFTIEPHPDLTSDGTSGRAGKGRRGEASRGASDWASMLAADAERRDFTLNALFRDPETGQTLDPTAKGLTDLEKRQLRTTHQDSFRDDPLRILRGARFASQHKLDVEPETFEQMKTHADAVTGLTQKGVSGTVRDELDKLIMSSDPVRGLRILRDSGALTYLAPELAPIIGFDQESKYHNLTVDEHTFQVLDQVVRQNGSLEARYAALFHDSGKPASAWRGADGRLHYYERKPGGLDSPEGTRDHAEVGAEIAQTFLERLNYPRAFINDVTTIIREHMLTAADKPKPIKARKMRQRLTDKQLGDLFIHRRADMRGKGEDDDPVASVDTSAIDRLEQMVRDAEGMPRSVADLAIDGNDLQALGIEPGPIHGEVLRELLHEVTAQPKLNTTEWLADRAVKLARRVR